MSKKVLLTILDGRGMTQDKTISAAYQAKTPNFDTLRNENPHTTLLASELAVGLPEGQMGNSEVGHMHIGAGRVIYQDLVRISKDIDEKTLHNHPVIVQALDYAKNNHSTVHILGVLSDGGVHGHVEHLKGICGIMKEHSIENFYIHAITDGRDSAPQGGVTYMQDLLNTMSTTGGKIASICGRYYAMDRDQRWDSKTKLAYDLYIHGTGDKNTDPVAAIQKNYDSGITDEFIKPIICDDNGTIKPNDVVIFANFRTDRARQLTTVLTQKDFPEFGMTTLPLYFVTMTNYDPTYQGIHVIYDKDPIVNTLGEVISAAGKTQVRAAETEKYPHVSFFFSGGKEEQLSGEDRILAPSPKVATYDLQPEMSAQELADRIRAKMDMDQPDFICLNFANPDMVGHTGVFEAVVTACETVDRVLGQVVETAKKHGYQTIIIADHGNAENMINPDGTAHTAHTINPVPCIIVGDQVAGKSLISGGALTDIAPTVLDLMGLEQPLEMTGKSLINK